MCVCARIIGGNSGVILWNCRLYSKKKKKFSNIFRSKQWIRMNLYNFFIEVWIWVEIWSQNQIYIIKRWLCNNVRSILQFYYSIPANCVQTLRAFLKWIITKINKSRTINVTQIKLRSNFVSHSANHCYAMYTALLCISWLIND